MANGPEADIKFVGDMEDFVDDESEGEDEDEQAQR